MESVGKPKTEGGKKKPHTKHFFLMVRCYNTLKQKEEIVTKEVPVQKPSYMQIDEDCSERNGF